MRKLLPASATIYSRICHSFSIPKNAELIQQRYSRIPGSSRQDLKRCEGPRGRSPSVVVPKLSGVNHLRAVRALERVPKGGEHR